MHFNAMPAALSENVVASLRVDPLSAFLKLSDL